MKPKELISICKLEDNVPLAVLTIFGDIVLFAVRGRPSVRAHLFILVLLERYGKPIKGQGEDDLLFHVNDYHML